MPCYFPVTGYRNAETGRVVFSDLKKHGKILRPITIPCGQCIGCKLERSRQWAMRAVHEASLHENNCMCTLTYNDEHLPFRQQLRYKRDVVLFLKRLRKNTGQKLSYMCAGEYGETDLRPHYHLLLFGYDFPDKLPLKQLATDWKYFKSELLTKTWGKGHTHLGLLNFESAAYVARYCLKKITGPNAKDHYKRHDEHGEYQQIPEFMQPSLNPAIGKRWLEKWKTDVYPHDYVVINGKKVKPPKYYDRIFMEADEWAKDDIEFARYEKALALEMDNTPERLEAKRIFTESKLKTLKREL